MDRDVAQTLGELERKLAELERTLNAISDGQTTPAPSQSHGWSRIVDETSRARPAAHTRAAATATGHTAPVQRGAILERSSGPRPLAAEGAAATSRTAATERGGAVALPRSAGARGARADP